MDYTYDRSHTLQLALVATDNLTHIRYVPLAEAPARAGRDLPPPYLKQLHAVAGSETAGLTVRMRQPYRPGEWERQR